MYERPSSVPPLAGKAPFVLVAGLPNGLHLGHFRRRDVPPDAGAGQIGVWDRRHHDDDRPVVIAGVGEGSADFGRGDGPDSPRTEPGCDLDEIKAEVLSREARALAESLSAVRSSALAVPELVAELAAAASHLQAVDDLVAMVFRDDDGDRQPFLRRGDQFGRCHQEGAVPDEGNDPLVAVGSASRTPRPAGIS